MGESRRKNFLRVIQGGLSQAPPPPGPPRLINITIQLDEPSYKAVERERAHVGIGGQSDFYTFLIGAGLGAVEVDKFIPAFKAYVNQISGMREADPAIPLPTIQRFSHALTEAGMATLVMQGKGKQPGGVAAPDDAAAIVHEGGDPEAPGPA